MFRRIVILSMALLMLALGAASALADEPERIDTNAASLANIYRVDDGFTIWRWNAVAKQGEFQFFVSYDEVDTALKLAKANNEHILLGASEDITFWALTSGQLQLNSVMIDGAAYEFVF